MSNDEDIKKYDSIISIWKRWDESYWTSFYVYIIVIGLFLAGFSQTIGRINIVALFICILGFLMSIYWLFILHKKYAHIIIAETEGKKIERSVFSNSNVNGCFTSAEKFKKGELPEISKIFGCRRFLTESSSGFVVSFIVPMTFLCIWFVLGYVSFVFSIIDLCDSIRCFPFIP